MSYGTRQMYLTRGNTYFWPIPWYLISLISGFHGGLVLVVSGFFCLYTVWMCVVLITFRKHPLLSSSGLEWVTCVSVRVPMVHGNRKSVEGNVIKTALLRATCGNKPSRKFSMFSGSKGCRLISTYMTFPVAYVRAEEQATLRQTPHLYLP
jgi:hypothetical protein